MSTTTRPTLAQQLSQPIQSVEHLLQLVLAQLDRLDLILPSEQQLARRYITTSPADQLNPVPGPSDHSRSNQQWLKRQLGLVQRAIILSIYPDWAEAIQTVGGQDLVELGLGRWFIPSPIITPTSTSPKPTIQPTAYAGQVALSGYAVISALLSKPRTLPLHPSTSTSAPTSTSLHPRSLDYALELVTQLSRRFSLPEVWNEVYGPPDQAGTATAAVQDETSAATDLSSDSDDDHHDHETGLKNQRWEAALKDLFGLGIRIANGCGVAAIDPPPPLEYK